MSSTSCKRKALRRLVVSWAAKIARCSGTIVEAIVMHVKNVRRALHAPKPHGRKAGELPALRSGLSRPMMSRLEIIGRRALLLRRRATTLPPLMSCALARKPVLEIERALMMGQRGKSDDDAVGEITDLAGHRLATSEAGRATGLVKPVLPGSERMIAIVTMHTIKVMRPSLLPARRRQPDGGLTATDAT